MAEDNIRMNPGQGGRDLAAKDHGNVMHQRVLPQHLVGDIPVDVDPSNPLPVDVSGQPIRVEQAAGDPLPVTQAVLPVKIQESLGSSYDVFSKIRLLKDDGGNWDASGNYSVTPGVFYVEPVVNTIFDIRNLGLFMGSDAALHSDGYGDIALPLTMGLVWRVTRDNGSTVVWNILDPSAPIKTNIELWYYAADSEELAYSQGMTSWAYNKFKFPMNGLRLLHSRGERLEVYLNDDFTAHLDEQVFTVEGRFYSEDETPVSDPDV